MSGPNSNLPRKTDPDDVATLDPEDAEGHLFAILGGCSRNGYWEPPARLRVYALMGGAELDFREASLFEGVTVLEVYALMGGASIIVPPDINVRTSGTGVLGGFGNVENRATEEGAPTLHIKGIAVMGGVDIKVKKLPLLKRLRSD